MCVVCVVCCVCCVCVCYFVSKLCYFVKKKKKKQTNKQTNKQKRKGPYPHILKLWEESTTAEHMISYRKPTFLWLRGFRLQLVTKLSVKQQGNAAGSHCAYFYKKIRDGEQQVPVAVAEAHVADAAPAVPASVVDALPEDVAVAVGVAASTPVAAAAATPDVVAVAEQPIVPEMISEVQPENPQVVDFLPLV